MMKKKSIITKGLLASGMLYASVNASNPTRMEAFNNENETLIEKNHHNTDIYHWRIKTVEGIFSGASETMDEINEAIVALTQNTRVITKSITPIAMSKNEPNEKIYTWSVVTKKGHASGQSGSLEEAKNMLESLGTKKIIKSNIIETKEILK